MTQEILSKYYDQFLNGMNFSVNNTMITGKDREAAMMATRLMRHAKHLDIQRTYALLDQPFNGTIKRNIKNPPFYTDEEVIGQIWADDEAHPLKPGQTWNYGNRGNASGITFSFDNEGKPVCPYFNFGINGRGIVGHYGPNHAVDMAPYQIRDNCRGNVSLFVRGIIRQDSGRPALCGGFTNFKQDAKGGYPYTKQIMIDTQADEFFEEMVSGSVELLPRYAQGLEEEIYKTIQHREVIQQRPLLQKQINTISAIATTHRKLQQVKTEDPDFITHLQHAFSQAHECYAGPVLSSPRNTNNAWMETRLSCFELNDAKWTTIKGKNKFNYEFTAGDDAQGVLWHEITPELINTADSHSALFCYVMASYLLTNPHQSLDVLQSVKYQTDALITSMSQSISHQTKLQLTI